ncbi:MAG: hypothetical protein H6Q54_1801, partial [Deltaproteobacteria bacterium]|nr:hypothetical protein [Deltaproteobacteria bacterium]
VTSEEERGWKVTGRKEAGKTGQTGQR